MPRKPINLNAEAFSGIHKISHIIKVQIPMPCSLGFWFRRPLKRIEFWIIMGFSFLKHMDSENVVDTGRMVLWETERHIYLLKQILYFSGLKKALITKRTFMRRLSITQVSFQMSSYYGSRFLEVPVHHDREDVKQNSFSHPRGQEEGNKSVGSHPHPAGGSPS